MTDFATPTSETRSFDTSPINDATTEVEARIILLDNAFAALAQHKDLGIDIAISNPVRDLLQADLKNASNYTGRVFLETWSETFRVWPRNQAESADPLTPSDIDSLIDALSVDTEAFCSAHHERRHEIRRLATLTPAHLIGLIHDGDLVSQLAFDAVPSLARISSHPVQPISAAYDFAATGNGDFAALLVSRTICAALARDDASNPTTPGTTTSFTRQALDAFALLLTPLTNSSAMEAATRHDRVERHIAGTIDYLAIHIGLTETRPTDCARRFAVGHIKAGVIASVAAGANGIAEYLLERPETKLLTHEEVNWSEKLFEDVFSASVREASKGEPARSRNLMAFCLEHFPIETSELMMEVLVPQDQAPIGTAAREVDLAVFIDMLPLKAMWDFTEDLIASGNRSIAVELADAALTRARKASLHAYHHPERISPELELNPRQLVIDAQSLALHAEHWSPAVGQTRD